MLTMRAAAALLSDAGSAEGLASLLRAARLLDTELSPLDAGAHEALGLDGFDGGLIGARGATRVLALPVRDSAAARDSVQRVVSKLAAHAPHVRWLVAYHDPGGSRSGVASWETTARSRRIVSFSWEPQRPTDSDAETLCALHAARTSDDEVTHARYVEVLGRDSLTRRFYRALETEVGCLAESAPPGSPSARDVALLYVSRLLFLCFLEAKGWLNGERAYLSNRFDECMAGGGRFHRRILLPLFFGTLNTPFRRRALAARELGRVPFLNGGLFTRTPVERQAGRWAFGDEALGRLFSNLFQRFQFVAREDSSTWSDSTVDPEMLGRAFESLMSDVERKSGGVFFTPHELVARVANEALDAAADAGRWDTIRVLDPACGSGAFLVHALERIAERRRGGGDPRGLPDIRREVLARSIFGVDRNPTAVWLCELRLWLSVVIELDEPDPMRVPPLPNLDRNIRVGDTLAGPAFADAAPWGSGKARQLRARYVRASGARKSVLARELDREERRRTLAQLEREMTGLRHARREQVSLMRARDLFGGRGVQLPKAETRRIRGRLRSVRAEWQRVAMGGALPFSFGAMFAEAHAAGGFDVIVGNPPWVRLHKIPETLRARFRDSFEVYRHASWADGARRASTATGFASQVDLAALFVERSLALLRPGGVLSLLVPVKLWQSLAGGGVRRLLAERSRLLRVEDLSESRHAFDAAVYPSLVVARASDQAATDLVMARTGPSDFREWRVRTGSLPFDETPGSPWLLLAPDARAAFHRVKAAGRCLADSELGTPRLGVKTGCNTAFLVRVVETTSKVAVVEDANGERGRVESRLLRPALRGDGVTPWVRRPAGESIVWTHDDRGPLAALPEHARAWLGRHHGTLSSRSDARSRRWWSLFRTDAAATDRPRLVWADFGRRPRALVLPTGDPAVPLNTCYSLHCPSDADAMALAAILNSDLASAWLNAFAESARGGFRRYLAWTVAHLPLPPDWAAVRDDLARAGTRAAAEASSGEALLEAVLAAYDLRRRDVIALLAP